MYSPLPPGEGPGGAGNEGGRSFARYSRLGPDEQNPDQSSELTEGDVKKPVYFPQILQPQSWLSPKIAALLMKSFAKRVSV